MDTSPNDDVTRLLLAWNEGSPNAAEELMPLVYEHLRTLARAHMRHERDSHTLQPTALVHEAYVRLVDGATVSWQGRAHFYSLASRAMRRILVDHARSHRALRRGGDQERIALLPAQEDEALLPEAGNPEADLVTLDAALDRLAASYPRPSQVVELRFFGGMEARDIAQALQVSDRTVKRDWQFAKVWLHRELGYARDDAF